MMETENGIQKSIRISVISIICTGPSRQLQALESFREHMQLGDDALELQECALLIAKHAHPSLVHSPPCQIRSLIDVF